MIRSRAPEILPGQVPTPLTDVPLPPVDPERLAPIVGRERVDLLAAAAEEARRTLAGRAFVNVNSTAAGGGVAEMLYPLLGYARAYGIDARWLVIGGDPAFFAVTKRIHNGLYGGPGDGGELGPAERRAYERPLADAGAALADAVRPDDLVLLHDPQTLGLVPRLRGRVARIVWRCHVGLEAPNEWAERAWAFLDPYLEGVDAFVFSREAFVPASLRGRRIEIVPPSIDPFTPKNEELPPEAVAAVLGATGLVAVEGAGAPPAPVERVELVGDGAPPPEAPLVVQVSRWDRMKDMGGVLRAFAGHVDPALGAHLVLAGPAVDGVSDDPEGAGILAEAVAAREALEPEARARVHLACIGMGDLAANARVVNALQRHAAVVVQKSLAEGFGLTVAEAMWKSRPVVASAVGGIVDQVEDGVHGLLVPPADLAAAGAAMEALLADPGRARRLGQNGRRRVVERFLADRHLLQYAELVSGLV